MNLRHLLDMVPNSAPTNGRKAQSSYANNQANFDTNMVIILAALLCALICALGLNSIVRCALRCTGRVSTAPAHERDGHLGPSSRGIKKSKLRKIPIFVYGLGTNDAIHSTDCPICIGEFEYGEKVRVLPKCHHGFHVKCIDIWLASHTSCPTCRQSLIELPEATDAEDMEAGFRQPSHGLTGFSIGESNASGAAEEVG